MTTAMPVPAVDVDAACADSERVRRAARLAATAADDVGRTAPSQWYGGAADAYDHARADLARYTDDVARLSSVLADAVARYAETVGPLLARMRSAAGDLETALRVQAADPGGPLADALVEGAWREYENAERAYQAAVLDAVESVERIDAEVGPLALGRGRHVRAGVQRFWDDAVVAPLALAWGLTGTYVTDRESWQENVSGVVPSLLDMVRHPVRTLDEMVGGPEWRAGEWGAGAGAVLAMAVPVGKLRRLTPATPEQRARYARNLADPTSPRPRLQTPDELLVRVDLRAHEHYQLGHTLRRHVHVGDDYLQDRLVHGTLYDEAVWGPPPRSGKASAWTDRATAEQWIGEALRRNEADFRAWAVSTEKVLELKLPAPGDVGRVMVESPDGFALQTPDSVYVLLRRDGDAVYITTAYPDLEGSTP